MSSQFIRCPACAQQVIFKPFKIKPKLNLNYKVFYISRCNNCGYVRQFSLCDKNVYKKLGYHTQTNYEEHCKNRAKYIFDFLGMKYIIMRYNKPFRILDLGSGKGAVGHFLRLEVLNFVSLDLIKSKAKITAKQLSKIIDTVQVTGVTLQQEEKTYIKTQYLNVDDVHDLDKLATKKYDLIIMSHSLEHLMHPEIVIDYIDRWLLNTNGLLYIEVPSLYTTNVRMSNTFIPQHISYFTQTSLRNLMRTNSWLLEVKTYQSNYWGNIKSLYFKSQDDSELKYKKEKFVEIKYLLSQIKNKINKIRVKYLHKKIKSND